MNMLRQFNKHVRKHYTHIHENEGWNNIEYEVK